MKTMLIEGKLINLKKIHFIRRESSCELIISFGTDFIKFTGSCEKLDKIYNDIYNNILNAIDE